LTDLSAYNKSICRFIFCW